VSKTTGSYPSPNLATAGAGIVSHAGATLLLDTIRQTGLEQALSTALFRWRRPTAVHDPAKILCDLAITLALGGDCLADITSLRTEPDLFGLIASDPTISRLIDTLARDVDRVLVAVSTARPQARTTTWALAADHAPDHDINPGSPLITDLDATLLDARSDKENTAPTFKRVSSSIRCARSSTTASRAPVNRWRSCCDQATPGPTSPPTTSP
jgi:Transposase DDE domain group 1